MFSEASPHLVTFLFFLIGRTFKIHSLSSFQIQRY